MGNLARRPSAPMSGGFLAEIDVKWDNLTHCIQHVRHVCAKSYRGEIAEKLCSVINRRGVPTCDGFHGETGLEWTFLRL